MSTDRPLIVSETLLNKILATGGIQGQRLLALYMYYQKMAGEPKIRQIMPFASISASTGIPVKHINALTSQLIDMKLLKVKKIEFFKLLAVGDFNPIPVQEVIL